MRYVIAVLAVSGIVVSCFALAAHTAPRHRRLDIFLSRRLGVPGNEEFAFGAIAANDGRFWDKEVVDGLRGFL
jgi:predicted phosphoribosyltransferase